MKIGMFVLVVGLAGASASAQKPLGPPNDSNLSTQAELARRHQAELAAKKERDVRANAAQSAAWGARMWLYTNDAPYRFLAGECCPMETTAILDTWQEFHRAKVLQRHPDGLRVSFRGDETVFIINHPLAKTVYDGSILPPFVAHDAGTHSYTSVMGANLTIRKFDFGKPYDPDRDPGPLPAIVVARGIQQEAAISNSLRAAMETKVRMSAATLRFHLAQASNGSPSAQCALGKRYLTGDGLPVDTNLALFWLRKAAAKGDAEAEVALKSLVVPK